MFARATAEWGRYLAMYTTQDAHFSLELIAIACYLSHTS